MIWLIGSLTYSLIALVTMRILTAHFAWWFHEHREYCFLDDTEPTGDQWVGAAFVAMMIAIVWPIAVFWTINFPAVGAAGRAKIRQQEERIKQLEREAGIS
jgi:hypothetical protein